MKISTEKAEVIDVFGNLRLYLSFNCVYVWTKV